MNVRDRVRQGKNVRVRPLADEVGVSVSVIYRWIEEGKLPAIRFEKTVLVPPDAARRLLGMEPAQVAA